MMRICLHTAWSLRANFIGGTERFLIELAKELQILGFEPFVLCSNLQPKLNIEGVEVRGHIPRCHQALFQQTDPNIAEYMRGAVYNQAPTKAAFEHISAYVQEQLAGVEADIFHLNAFSAALFVDLPSPLVVTNHENEQELDAFWHEGAFQAMTNLVRDDVDAFASQPKLFTPSLYYAREYSQRFERPVQSNPLGANLVEFIPPIGPVRKRDRKTVLMPSRFFPAQKGQDIALKACKLLHEAGHRDLTFLFTGVRDYYGGAVDTFREEASALGVSDNIRIKNYVRIQDALEEADVVISPERYCSYGLSITEALAFGKPTVVTTIPTYREIASDYSHAFFVRVDDARGLADAILQAASRTEKRQSDTIRFRMANDFRDCAKRYAEAYLELSGI